MKLLWSKRSSEVQRETIVRVGQPLGLGKAGDIQIKPPLPLGAQDSDTFQQSVCV